MFDINNENSLHDSIIEEIKFINDPDENNSNMIITLLGENRLFKICYYGITTYRIEQNCRTNFLLTFEIGFEKNKYNDDVEDDDIEEQIVFRAKFCDGEIEIFCESIKIEEIIQ